MQYWNIQRLFHNLCVPCLCFSIVPPCLMTHLIYSVFSVLLQCFKCGLIWGIYHPWPSSVIHLMGSFYYSLNSNINFPKCSILRIIFYVLPHDVASLPDIASGSWSSTLAICPSAALWFAIKIYLWGNYSDFQMVYIHIRGALYFKLISVCTIIPKHFFS